MEDKELEKYIQWAQDAKGKFAQENFCAYNSAISEAFRLGYMQAIHNLSLHGLLKNP